MYVAVVDAVGWGAMTDSAMIIYTASHSGNAKSGVQVWRTVQSLWFTLPMFHTVVYCAPLVHR